MVYDPRRRLVPIEFEKGTILAGVVGQKRSNGQVPGQSPIMSLDFLAAGDVKTSRCDKSLALDEVETDFASIGNHINVMAKEG